MISRVWHGWTSPANADAYQALLLGRILPGIIERGGAGVVGAQLDRRLTGDEVEFVTTISFTSIDAVIAFAGADHEVAVVPPDARALLARFESTASHFERIATFGATTP
jgi:hypothetical protein